MAKTPKRRSYHHGDLRNALVVASLEAIAEHGVEGFTLREAARRAGVSPAAPYRHFADRDQLLAAVAADCAERLGAALDEAAAAAPAADALAVFRASGIAYVRFAVTHPAHFRVMNMPAVIAQTPADVVTEIAAWQATARTSLIEAQAAGAMSDQPIDDIMLAARCLTHGLAHLLVGGHAGPVDADRAQQMAEAVTEILGNGLLPRAERPKTGRRGTVGVSGDDRRSASSTDGTSSSPRTRTRRRPRSTGRS